MFSFFKKEKWALVKTLDFKGIMYGGQTGGVIYIHLFESDKGNRRIENACSFSEVPQLATDSFVSGSELYQKRLFRWKEGRYDPTIPRYSEIGEEDTANALRGKVE